MENEKVVVKFSLPQIDPMKCLYGHKITVMALDTDGNLKRFCPQCEKADRNPVSYHWNGGNHYLDIGDKGDCNMDSLLIPEEGYDRWADGIIREKKKGD